MKPLPRGIYEPERDFSVLGPWETPRPSSFAMEMRADPARDKEAAVLMPEAAVLCHISTSQPKKEWPLRYWLELGKKAGEAGIPVVFSSGSSPRERGLLEELKSADFSAATLPTLKTLDEFLAVLNRARLFVGGDTGPLHFAAALSKPTLALFGPSLHEQWAPKGENHVCLTSKPCTCSVHASVCNCTPPCMETIEVEQVLNRLKSLLEKQTS